MSHNVMELFKKTEEWLLNYWQRNKNLSTVANDTLLKDFDVPGGERARGFIAPVWNPTYVWTGFIPQTEPRNHVFNETIFSICEGKPYILRGYPVAKHIKNPNFNVPMIAQPSYDGLRVEFFRLPNGITEARTRKLEYLDRNSLYTRNYNKLFDKTGLRPNIEHFLDDNPNLVLIGEMFGNNEALQGIMDYDKEVEWLAFDILVQDEYRFLHWEEAFALFDRYGIPHVKNLSEDEYEGVYDIHEGIVFKYYEDGELVVNKLLSKNYLNAFSEPESLHSKRMRACMRELYECTCEFHSYFTDYGLREGLNKYRFSSDFIEKFHDVIIHNVYANDFVHTDDEQLLSKVESFLDICFFGKGVLYTDIPEFEKRLRVIMELVDKAVNSKERVDVILKHWFLNKGRDKLGKLVDSGLIDKSMLEVLCDEKKLTAYLKDERFQNLNTEIKKTVGIR